MFQKTIIVVSALAATASAFLPGDVAERLESQAELAAASYR